MKNFFDITQAPVDQTIQTLANDFRRVGRGFSTTHILPDIFPADSTQSRYRIVPLLLVVGDPEEWDCQRNSTEAASVLLKNLDDVVQCFIETWKDDAIRAENLVFFQLGDYEETLPSLRKFKVFKNSARRDSSDLSLAYFVMNQSDRDIAPISQATIEVSFRGAVKGMPLREKLRDFFQNYSGTRVRASFQESYNIIGITKKSDYCMQYRDLMADSKFVLCPRGTGLSSYRLYETIAYGRIPIIISDNYKLPEVGIDWRNLSIQVGEDDLDSIPEKIHEFASTKNLEQVSETLKECFDRFFANSSLAHQIRSSLYETSAAYGESV